MARRGSGGAASAPYLAPRRISARPNGFLLTFSSFFLFSFFLSSFLFHFCVILGNALRGSYRARDNVVFVICDQKEESEAGNTFSLSLLDLSLKLILLNIAMLNERVKRLLISQLYARSVLLHGSFASSVRIARYVRLAQPNLGTITSMRPSFSPRLLLEACRPTPAATFEAQETLKTGEYRLVSRKHARKNEREKENAPRNYLKKPLSSFASTLTHPVVKNRIHSGSVPVPARAKRHKALKYAADYGLYIAIIRY